MAASKSITVYFTGKLVSRFPTPSPVTIRQVSICPKRTFCPILSRNEDIITKWYFKILFYFFLFLWWV